MTSRRGFMAGLLAVGLSPAPSWADAGNPKFLSGAKTTAGTFVLAGLNAEGAIRFQIPLPDRGHAATAHPFLPHAVAFARRPGRFAMVIDCRDGAVLAELDSPQGRHFYGHGTYDHTGDWLFTTENDYDNGQGRIGVWDARNGYRRIGEFASHGVGPHDLKRLPDGNLVVANGGIDTHPDTGRRKLNLPTMQPNLSYLDANGTLLDSVRPNQSAASVRHLAVGADGTVAIGMQWQNDVSQSPALVALHRRGEALRTLGTGAGLNGYVGSIAISADGQNVAVTSPRSGQLQVFSTQSGAQHQTVLAADVAGVAPLAHGFVATTGQGRFVQTGASDQMVTAPGLAWDNHLVEL
ncbi:MAG: DUF1513 domain-containing protein [Thalassovita sp.]